MQLLKSRRITTLLLLPYAATSSYQRFSTPNMGRTEDKDAKSKKPAEKRRKQDAKEDRGRQETAKKSKPSSSSKIRYRSVNLTWKFVTNTKSLLFRSSTTAAASSSSIVDKSSWTAALPTRNKRNELVFEGHDGFRPNRTPKEVLQVSSILFSNHWTPRPFRGTNLIDQ